MKFTKSLWGFKPSEVTTQIENINNEYQQKAAMLVSEIEQARLELLKAQDKHEELQKQLQAYIERERSISDVMIAAQVNAQKIEEQARERARQTVETAEKELQQKLQELDMLRIKVSRFKEDFRDILDNYRVSLDNVREKPEEAGFTPTIINTDNKRHDVSS